MAADACGSHCESQGHSHGDNSPKSAEMDIFKAAKSGCVGMKCNIIR